jgi:FAD/FMN-containing dehydrogenase
MIVEVKVETADQIGEVLRTVADRNVLVQPRGSGSWNLHVTSTVRPGLRLELGKLNRITRVADADFFITCQPGVLLAELATQLETRFLSFPFLSEQTPGTVGGMVAAGQIRKGELAYRIARWVPAVKLTTASGESTGAGAVTFKSVAGYDLPRLLCGSFGTLAIITEITLRVYPRSAKPYGRDLRPIRPRRPSLAGEYNRPDVLSAADKIARRIKHSFDPGRLFPVISAWNRN